MSKSDSYLVSDIHGTADGFLVLEGVTRHGEQRDNKMRQHFVRYSDVKTIEYTSIKDTNQVVVSIYTSLGEYQLKNVQTKEDFDEKCKIIMMS
jgi:hypothetical protein